MSHDDCACPISAEVSIDQPPKNQRSRVSAALTSLTNCVAGPLAEKEECTKE